MNKKVLLSTLLGNVLTLSTSSLQANAFDCFYAGLGFGHVAGQVKFLDVLAAPHYEQRVRLTSNGVYGNLFAGYGYTFQNCLYSGIEIFGTTRTAQGYYTLTSPTYVDSFRAYRKFSYGALLAPGFVYQNWLLSGLIGIESQRWSVGITHFIAPISLHDSRHASRIAGLLGLRLEGALCSNFRIGLSTMFTRSRTAQFTLRQQTAVWQERFYFKTMRTEFRIAYQFG